MKFSIMMKNMFHSKQKLFMLVMHSRAESELTNKNLHLVRRSEKCNKNSELGESEPCQYPQPGKSDYF